MCGVVGYIGNRQALPLIMNGLKRLEYRGYDSAGVAVHDSGEVQIVKESGKLSELEKLLNKFEIHGSMGIGHTRWATHGEPNRTNAHPHNGLNGEISIIVNGIVENYSELKQFLSRKGHTFKSETDTEVLAHFIEYFYEMNDDLDQAVRDALSQVVGAYGLVAISRKDPDKIVAARKGSPLIVGIGKDEYFVASDVAAIVDSTRNVIYLNDGEMVILTRTNYEIKTIDNKSLTHVVQEVTYNIEAIEKGGFDHFMLKEIFEQPKTVEESMRGRLIENGLARLGGLSDYTEKLLNADRIIITACGTSWHASLIGEYMLEEFCRIPVEVEYASEFRYRDPVITEKDVLIAVSQSGETADTLAALREAKNKGATTIGVCNVVGSSIARETDAGVYIHAGPEIGVASTKAFTSQVTVFALMALMLGRKRNMSSSVGMRFVKALRELPEQIQWILDQSDSIKHIADVFTPFNNALYLGRGYNFPVALEGALKLKEISYIHAEGYPAAEMKHGPIALIDENMPVVFIATDDAAIYDKVVSNIEQVKARNGYIIAIATAGNEQIKNLADDVIYIPKTLDPLTPILANVPLQLLSYFVAVNRGCNVDQPRNLAKSVTVE